MNGDEPLAVLVRGKLDSMKELQALLKKRGIHSEIRRPDEKGCGTG
jgi:hypothetical protein